MSKNLVLFFIDHSENVSGGVERLAKDNELSNRSGLFGRNHVLAATGPTPSFRFPSIAIRA
jgi:hypothetical protein